MAPSPHSLAQRALANYQILIFSHSHIRTMIRRPQVNSLLRLTRPHPHLILVPQSCRFENVRHYSRGRVSKPKPDARRSDVLKEKTYASLLNEGLSKQDDVGLFPSTVLITSKRDWPSWLRSPVVRGKMEYQHLRLKLGEFVSMLNAKASQGFLVFFRTSVPRRGLDAIALALYEQMNEAIAKGDLKALDDIAVSTLSQKVAERIAERQGLEYEWSFATSPATKDNTAQSPTETSAAAPKATIMTNRVSPFPEIFRGRKKQWLRQAVVRIQSEQRLQLVGRNERGDEEKRGQPITRFVDEMVVIQRVLWDVNGHGSWKIWGTTKPTAVENWDEVVTRMAR